MGLIRVVLDLSTSNFFVLFFNFHQTGAVVHFFYLQGNRLSFFARRGEVELPEVLVLTLPCTIDLQNRKQKIAPFQFCFLFLVLLLTQQCTIDRQKPDKDGKNSQLVKTGYRKLLFLKFICCLFFSPLVDTAMDNGSPKTS